MAFAQFKDSFIIALPYFSIIGSMQRSNEGNNGSNNANYASNSSSNGNYGDI